MRKIITITLFALLTLTSFLAIGQEPTLDWVKQIGNSNHDAANAIAHDNYGNSYVVGTFNNTVDFDPSTGISNMTSNGAKDIYIIKLDINGDFIWSKQIGGTLNDNVASIAVDNLGFIYITGVFTNTTDFDPNSGVHNLTAISAEDVFILKLNVDGDFQWAKQFESASNTQVFDVHFDNAGNVYTTGYFWGTVDFDPNNSTAFNLTALGSSDSFIVKLNTSGNFIWAKQLGGNFEDVGNSISIDSANNVYSTGYFTGVVDFNPGAGVYNLSSDATGDYNYYNGYVSKLDTDGNFIWAKKLSSNDDLYANSIAIDTSGNCYISGFFEGTADFDPSTEIYTKTALGGLDTFITKLDVLGNFIWARHIANNSNNFSFSSNIDITGNTYITGRFNGLTNFDDVNTYNLSAFGASDIFITKFDSSGTFQWAKQFGGASSEGGNSISIDYAGDVYTIGGFANTANFGVESHTFNLSSAGGNDTFIQKLTKCNLNNTVSNNSNVLVSNNAIGTYQWINCDNGNTPISGETNQSFTPSTTGNYAVKITNNNCTTISDCIEITSLGIDKYGINSISFYPNPAKTNLWFNLKNNTSIQITLIDSLGRIIIDKQINNHKGIIGLPLTNINNGIYFVKMTQEKNEIVKKLVIKN